MIKDDFFILSSTNCPACKQVKRIVGNKLPIYDVSKSDEACDFAVQHNIFGVPTAVKKVGNKFRRCNIVVSANKITIECGKTPMVFQK